MRFGLVSYNDPCTISWNSRERERVREFGCLFFWRSRRLRRPSDSHPIPIPIHPSVISTLCCRQISQARLLVGIFLVGLCRPWYFGSFFPRLGDLKSSSDWMRLEDDWMRLEDDSFWISVPLTRGYSFIFGGGKPILVARCFMGHVTATQASWKWSNLMTRAVWCLIQKTDCFTDYPPEN